jgi:hypothetical protein
LANAQIGVKGWYINSGATKHMTCNKNWLVSYKNDVNDTSVTCANNEKFHCEGAGKAISCCMTNLERQQLRITMLHMCQTAANLLSVNILAERGLTTIFSEIGCHIYKNKDVNIDGVVFASASEESGMYRLNCNAKATVETTMVAIVERNQVLWHRRLAHQSHQTCTY